MAVKGIPLLFNGRQFPIDRIEDRPDGRIDIDQEVFAKLLVVFGGAALWGHRAEDLINIGGEIGAVLALPPLFPSDLGKGGVGGGILASGDARLVPIGRAAERGVGEARDQVAGFEADLRGIHFEPGPVSGIRKGAHIHFLGGAGLSELDGFVISPHRAVQPSAFMKLQHDGLRGVRGIEIHVGKELP